MTMGDFDCELNHPQHEQEAPDYFTQKAHPSHGPNVSVVSPAPGDGPNPSNHTYHSFPRHFASSDGAPAHISTPQGSTPPLSPSISVTSGSNDHSHDAGNGRLTNSSSPVPSYAPFHAPPYAYSLQPAVSLHRFLHPTGLRGFQLPQRPPPGGPKLTTRGGTKRPALSRSQALSHAFPTSPIEPSPPSRLPDPSPPPRARPSTPSTSSSNAVPKQQKRTTYTPYIDSLPSPTFRSSFSTASSSSRTPVPSSSRTGQHPQNQLPTPPYPLSLTELQCLSPHGVWGPSPMLSSVASPAPSAPRDYFDIPPAGSAHHRRRQTRHRGPGNSNVGNCHSDHSSGSNPNSPNEQRTVRASPDEITTSSGLRTRQRAMATLQETPVTGGTTHGEEGYRPPAPRRSPRRRIEEGRAESSSTAHDRRPSGGSASASGSTSSSPTTTRFDQRAFSSGSVSTSEECVSGEESSGSTRTATAHRRTSPRVRTMGTALDVLAMEIRGLKVDRERERGDGRGRTSPPEEGGEEGETRERDNDDDEELSGEDGRRIMEKGTKGDG